ncbi:MAG: TIGR04100 family radical SAM protein [Clostridia bacterium]|nr:TIGR04100 family radical SAM protein [Clostridia bacterium]
MVIFYELYGALYVNITNKCPCSCVFCIRDHSDVIKDSDPLWFEGDEPTMEDIKKDFERFDIEKYSEIVFCGYGEPTERMDILKETAKFLRDRTNKKIRLNTNGLSDLICQRKNTALELKGLIDTVSISLNAPDAKRFCEITNSCFGEKSFDALLDFAKDAKKVIPNVVFTLVDVISKEEIEKCKNIADSLDIELRVREYIETY